MGNVMHFPAMRPPVFKIRAEIEVWRKDDVERVSTIVVSEHIVTTTPNRRDMQSLARSSVLGRLGKLGVDVMTLDDQFLSVEFFAARSRSYAGTAFEAEPEWVPATEDLATKNAAVANLTYLPYDLVDQREVYGS